MTSDRFRALVAGAILICFTACGEATAGSTDEPRSVGSTSTGQQGKCLELDVAALRMGSADYDPLTPVELANQVDLVARAELIGIEEGYSALDGSDLLSYLFLVFKVTQTLSSDPQGLIVDDEVRVRISQGPVSVERGVPSFSIEDFRRALPKGIQTMLFLHDITNEVRSAGTGLLVDAPVGGAGIQGMVIENCGALIGGHEDLEASWLSFESLDGLSEAAGAGSQ